MGRAQRAKGCRGERATAQDIRETFPEIAETVRRGWQTRLGGDAPDVIVPDELGLWIENKCGKQPNIRQALVQAVTESKGRGIPIAVVRDDRKDPTVTLLWSDFLRILRERFDLRQNIGEVGPMQRNKLV